MLASNIVRLGSKSQCSSQERQCLCNSTYHNGVSSLAGLEGFPVAFYTQVSSHAKLCESCLNLLMKKKVRVVGFSN